ncbi:SDR family NAD(P)-dependent oxidoreductase [Pauljensenia hongkongensis]|uniref:Short-chain dehydrogenase n=1 Tax=Pauljensenia hongkongensis TaxID=178339 RepID=A0A1D8B2G1_9ACTO|nr:SDR family NAD(P)-dependent oxidoreductase [Pauljensenia hongkongensis]AOS47323.1 short-chain dehydrogenase [Pauljensenia hongkongensis]EFW09948.1 short-chain dehydrogenase/reductase family oxidoreductase [Actinomyces sp. oral taxon 178 str. F0338]RKV64321.1 MAG: SDR family NAD(P)-dependent oxidoreductase [Actinomyces sp.]
MGTALVTGATSGLGEEFCWQLAAGGHDLVLVARREQVLEALADKLRNVAGVGAQVIAADLSTPEGVAAVSRRLDVGGQDGPCGTDGDPGGARGTEGACRGTRGSAGGTGEGPERPVDLLVNNAGFGLGRAFVDNSVANEERGLDVMVRAVMVLSHHAARSMRSRGRGAVLNIGSVASRTGGGTYSAHKAWVVAFTEGLSEELAGTGVSATVVCPGPVATSFFANAGIDLGGRLAVATPERVVADALQAVRAGRVQTTPTLTYKAAMAAMKVAPRALVLRAMRFLPHM